jgi:hypothetical protein
MRSLSLVAGAVLCLLVSSAPAAVLSFSNDIGSLVSIVGTGPGTGTLSISGTSNLNNSNDPALTPLVNSKVTIGGSSLITSLVILNLQDQIASLSGPQIFTLTTASGSVLTGNVNLLSVQSSKPTATGGLNLINVNNVINLSFTSLSLNGADAAQDLALTALNSTGGGTLRINTSFQATGFQTLSQMLVSGTSVQRAYTMSLDAGGTLPLSTSVPEPGSWALLGAGLLWLSRRRP